MEDKKKRLLHDLYLILILLILALSVFLIFRLSARGGTGVRIYKGDELIGEYPLSEDREIECGTNTVCIEDGSAYMIFADCPDRLCVGQGRIKNVGERIICLPNKLIVEIVGDGEEII